MRGELETGRGEVVGLRWAMQKVKEGDGPGRTGPGLGQFGLMGLGFILFYFYFLFPFKLNSNYLNSNEFEFNLLYNQTK